MLEKLEDIKHPPSLSENIPENIKEYLTDEEGVLYSGEEVIVDGEKGFSFAVTNKRIIFAKKKKIHEMRHRLISSISWERKRRFPLWLIVIGIVCIIGGIIQLKEFIETPYSYYSEESLKWCLTGIIIGIPFILLPLLFQQEHLVFYSSGRTMKITGKKEILEKLMKVALKILKSEKI
ncbi:MAG: hypothetical protein CO145_00375 [Candidatus Nealsonbacteria bacterium CG_4_9_14_3_um_filter_37_13]|uniref:Uncharacterized protein n=1 Tax=Candidatus Nealsonbacteria bacterium CG_4_9_14_3_um_filter_37_13 TaxID=1974695 RepID=A0A2M7Z5T4_9BACT|nr:MAG: hypothetical protein CO145_00375 [Candidatus Nealsonbacteria bacterium CG_4_9_14_3_um_filter_37_13]